MENQYVFHKLAQQGINSFTVDKKKAFVANIPIDSFLEQAFDFAFAMTFGESGHHRNHRTGGLKHRELPELFANTLQGKLAEFAFYQLMKNDNIAINLPDINTLGEGVWDSGDFQFGDTKISIKSGAHFANLMLFEKKDWDNHGRYLPDGLLYNVFVFCRIKPNAKELVTTSNEREQLWESVKNQDWQADIPGFITRKDFCVIWASDNTIAQGATLNKTTMDAENLYVQCGDLRPIESLTSFLKTLPR